MFSRRNVLTTAILISPVLSIPYPLLNTTTTTTTPNSSTTTLPSSIPQYHCKTAYPSDLLILNARYPDYTHAHLHSTTQLFQLRRQTLSDGGEIATRVQFTALPALPNTTCRLELVLPRAALQRVSGPNPSFDVWMLDGAPGAWAPFAAPDAARSYFGAVNGEARALARTRSVGGVVAVNETACAETMTFAMGMKYDGGKGQGLEQGVDGPNYWEFVNVGGEAWPVQGWRVVWGC
ncbi:hypothetical protein ACN47E_007261 [Coniothyrium glycines]